MLIYANCPFVFDVPPQWTVIGLSLNLDKKLWCLLSVLLDLGTVTLISS